MGARKKKGKKQKNRSYYMRYKPKMRRRRQAKTDYQARTTLIAQQKCKYNTPKYRFVVRISNRNIVCQVISATTLGDRVFAAAYSHELPRYGLKVGLTNYAACYCTGLLLARRLLKKVDMEDYEGLDEPNGEYFMEEADYDEENPKEPFECYLDVGLRRTTTGCRVFAAMKGATDGGLKVPHRDTGKQFPGWVRQSNESDEFFDPEICRKYIMGGHVADYMRLMESENKEKYKDHFAKYLAEGLTADNLEAKYAEVHAAIRKNPGAMPKKEKDKAQKTKYKGKEKLTLAERKDHVLNRILALRAKATSV